MDEGAQRVVDGTEQEEEEEEMRRACVQVYKMALGTLPSMVTRAACELGIPDILLAHQPLSALHLARHLPYPTTPPPQHHTAAYLDRIMTFLCAHGVFKVHLDASVEQPARYCLTPVSRCLLKSSAAGGSTGGGGIPFSADMAESCLPGSGSGSNTVDDKSKMVASLAPSSQSPRGTWQDGRGDVVDTSLRDYLLMITCGVCQPPLQHLANFILEGGEVPFARAHGMDLWPFTNLHPHFGHVFNAAMSCDSQFSMEGLFKHYDGFKDVHTLVDVGGGVGTAASCIVTRYPFIKAVNFDLPHVVAVAPMFPGVEHIGGDMLEYVPTGDAIFLKWMLHVFDDENCIKILNNCRKVLPKHGKVIIMDAVLDNTFIERNSFSNLRLAFDMLMLVYTRGGKERSKQQWECILKAAQFHHLKFIELPSLQCVIEAFPALDTNIAIYRQ